MLFVIILLIAAQVICLCLGVVQGFRYIKDDPFIKAMPWLLPALLMGAVVPILALFI